MRAKLFLQILVCLICFSNYGQNAGDLDTSFNTGDGARTVYFQDAIAVQSDGKVLVGGRFLNYNNQSMNRIVRLNADGSVDSSFTIGAGFNNIVRCITVQSDGKILVGGLFTTYNNTSANRIIRLNADGTIDTTFATGTGFDSFVNTINILPNGNIAVGGNFTTYNGSGSQKAIVLTPTGSAVLFAAFSSNVVTSPSVTATLVQTDGKVVVGGNFNSFATTNIGGLIRFNADSSLDTVFNGNITSVGFNNSTVNAIVQQADGKLIVGGTFTTFNGTTVNRILRLNTDGTLDASFNSGGSGFDAGINELAIDGNGKIIVGGFFSTYNGVSHNAIIRLNSDGTIDTSFTSGLGLNGTVSSLFLTNSNDIFIGGNFSSYNGITKKGIVKLNNDGSVDNNFIERSGFTVHGYVFTTITLPDNKMLAAGDFKLYKDLAHTNIVKLNTDGSFDSTFALSGIGFNNVIWSLALQNDGKILAGGVFGSYNGQLQGRIIRLNSDGSRDATFNIGSGFNSSIRDMKIQADGKIIVVGDFTTYNGTNYGRIVRLNTDGTLDTTFNNGNAGFNDVVVAVEIQSNAKIIVSGAFTTYNGLAANKVISLNTDGSLDTTFNTNLGLGLDDTCEKIIKQNDGKLLLVGDFTSFNGNSANRMTRLNSDGTLDTTFSIGTGFNGEVFDAVVLPDAKIVVGGVFTSFNGNTANRIVKLNANGSLDSTIDFGSGFDNNVFNVDFVGNRIIACGAFNTYKGTSANNIVKLHIGTLSSEDFEYTNLKIYPNPVDNVININAELGDQNYLIYNIDGRNVSSQVHFMNANNLDVSQLAKGMYFVKINTEKGQFIAKFLKN